MINLDQHQNLLEVLDVASKQNEKVMVVLDNGKEYSGKPKKLNDQFFLIREISGKEFYDAIIKLDKIVSVEVKAR